MKFIDSGTNKDINFSFVIVEHLNKRFFGQSYCIDGDDFSNITGCRYAQTKAEIKALKYELQLKKKACDECRKFVNAVSQYKNFDRTSPTAKAMYRQLNRRIKEVNTLIERINQKQFSLKTAMRAQDNFNTKAKKINQ